MGLMGQWLSADTVADPAASVHLIEVGGSTVTSSTATSSSSSSSSAPCWRHTGHLRVPPAASSLAGCLAECQPSFDLSCLVDRTGPCWPTDCGLRDTCWIIVGVFGPYPQVVPVHRSGVLKVCLQAVVSRLPVQTLLLFVTQSTLLCQLQHCQRQCQHRLKTSMSHCAVCMHRLPVASSDTLVSVTNSNSNRYFGESSSASEEPTLSFLYCTPQPHAGRL